MDIFVTQEGAVFNMAYATCPGCAGASRLVDKRPVTGYFLCPACSCLFDEPVFDPAEVAFIGTAYSGDGN